MYLFDSLGDSSEAFTNYEHKLLQWSRQSTHQQRYSVNRVLDNSTFTSCLTKLTAIRMPSTVAKGTILGFLIKHIQDQTSGQYESKQNSMTIHCFHVVELELVLNSQYSERFSCGGRGFLLKIFLIS